MTEETFKEFWFEPSVGAVSFQFREGWLHSSEFDWQEMRADSHGLTLTMSDGSTKHWPTASEA